MISEKQIEVFLALYHHRNMTKAAGELFMTRQALSANIQNLENDLGVELFIRSNKGLSPTENADNLYVYCKKNEQLWMEFLETIKEDEISSLRVALHLMYFPAETIRLIKSIGKDICGENTVLINIINSNDCKQLLEENMADLAITHKPPESDILLWEKIQDNAAYLIMREDDPLAVQDVISFAEDCKGRNLIFPSEETMRDVEKILTAEGATCSLISSDRVLLRESIISDGSVMVVPSSSLQNFMSEGMTAKLLKDFPVTNGVYVIYRKRTETVQRFIQTLFYAGTK